MLDLIAELNADAHVHGILALMPMQGQIDQNKVFNAIAPIKDLDCVNPANIGHVLLGDQLFAPATPSACIEILDRERRGSAGPGRDDRQPLEHRRQAASRCSASIATPRCTWCTCSARTCRPPVVRPRSSSRAAPVQNLIKTGMVKPGAIVIDVTTIRHEGKQVGSLDFEAVCEVAVQVTPVPGGVGPVTNVMLLKNALVACKAQTGVS